MDLAEEEGVVVVAAAEVVEEEDHLPSGILLEKVVVDLGVDADPGLDHLKENDDPALEADQKKDPVEIDQDLQIHLDDLIKNHLTEGDQNLEKRDLYPKIDAQDQSRRKDLVLDQHHHQIEIGQLVDHAHDHVLAQGLLNVLITMVNTTIKMVQMIVVVAMKIE